ncbi:MAG: hypothetical protein KF903_03405 [Dokdonella sp.]|uniref:hypothetical protein n=1 Tax=Dokdonella sp. TaxID=2291710 RepID=UPI0025BCBAE1|nr:hypothetical protein [Dokdonella sp.]MBX3700029.1 hypothetical protein [Dokdonella sp.]
MKHLYACLAIAALAASTTAHAAPQSLTAQVGDIAFEAGDDDIMLVPLDDSFALSASTKGSAQWPPPKTRVDRLAISCDHFQAGQTLLLDDKAFARSTCDVSFEVGHKGMGKDPDATWKLDKGASGNRFEITRAQGKQYEGRFTFHLKDAGGKAIEVRDGRFVIEDRQL